MNASKCWYDEVCEQKTDKCPSGCIRYTEMRYLISHSNLPETLWYPTQLVAPNVDLEAFKHLNQIKQNMTDFVTNGDNLYICGNQPGTGKTSWAVKMMLSYFNEIWYGNGLRERALFIPVNWFLIKNKDFRRVDEKFEDLKELIMKVDLIVWDEICNANLSDYDFNSLYMYLDYRRSNCMANIFTGNVTTREGVSERFGQRLTDRIWSKSTDIVEFKSQHSMR